MTAAVGAAGAGARREELLDALTEAGLAPEADPRRIAEYSYDASNYRVVPAAVVFPRTESEVAAAMAVATDSVCRTARGAEAGNAIGDGPVLDLSRHMNWVLADEAPAPTPSPPRPPRPASRSPTCGMPPTPPPTAARPSPPTPRASRGLRRRRSATTPAATTRSVTAAPPTTSRPCAWSPPTAADRHPQRHQADPRCLRHRSRPSLTAQLRDLAADHLGAIRTELGRFPGRSPPATPAARGGLRRGLRLGLGGRAIVTPATPPQPRAARTGLRWGCADVVKPHAMSRHPPAPLPPQGVTGDVETMRRCRGADPSPNSPTAGVLSSTRRRRPRPDRPPPRRRPDTRMACSTSSRRPGTRPGTVVTDPWRRSVVQP